MKKILKDNVKIISAFIIGLLISGVSVYAAALITSDTVSYDDGTVEEALNHLYDKAEKIGSIKKFCKLLSGNFGEVGSKYECDPGDGVNRNFYLLTIHNEKVDLIMESNINEGTMSWNNAMKYFITGAGKQTKESWINVQDVDLPDAQAIADIAKDNATASNGSPWLSSDGSTDWFCFGTHKQDHINSPYCNAETNKPYAWLFNHLTDCLQTGCTDASGATAYGYWTKDLIVSIDSARRVTWAGLLGYTKISDATYSGVRPVITVLKYNLYQ